MAIDPEVFRAILAMDSYHRGGAGLNLVGSQLGTAEVRANSADESITGASFFAQAYSWNGCRLSLRTINATFARFFGN